MGFPPADVRKMFKFGYQIFGQAEYSKKNKVYFQQNAKTNNKKRENGGMVRHVIQHRRISGRQVI